MAYKPYVTTTMSASRTVTPGEIAAGQHLTILEAIEAESYREQDMLFGARSSGSMDGVPLRVLAVDLPFVLVEMPNGNKFSLDTRKHRLMELRPEFVQAFASQPGPAAGVTFEQVVTAHNTLADAVRHHSIVLETLSKPPPAAPAITPPPRKKSWWRFW